MKRRDIRREAVHKALTDLIDAIPCWPLDYLEFIKIINEIDNEFN